MNHIEPYRPMFILGWLLGILGVGLWLISLNFHQAYSFSLFTHGHFMIYGLFLSFVSGFLMTALPRMLAVRSASPAEIATGLTLIVMASVLALAGHLALASLTIVAQFAFLISFAGRRYWAAQRQLPFGFAFVPAGLGWGGLGAIILAASYGGWGVPPPLYSLAKIGMQQGFLLNLIIGFGSRLIPFLTRQVSDPFEVRRESRYLVILIFLGLNFSFVLEGIFFSPVLYLVRAFIVGLTAWALLGVHRNSPVRTYLGIGIRLALVGLIVGYLCVFLYPAQLLTMMHIVFISGYSLLTTMIATRVTIAHGGGSTEIELHSRALLIIVALTVSAAVCRALGLLSPAGFLWLGGALLWIYQFGPYLVPSLKRSKARGNL